MTLTFDPETLFKVITHSLPKGNLWMKYEPNWLKGERTYDPEKDSSQTLRSFIMSLTFDL